MTAYRYELDISIPNQRLNLGSLGDDLERAGADLTTTVRRSVAGEVEVAAGVDYDQVRQYLVNEVCKDHLGSTVTVDRFVLDEVAR